MDDYSRVDEIFEQLRTMSPEEQQSEEGLRLFRGLREMGMYPPVVHVDDEGEPIYTVQQVAEWLGVPAEEVVKRCKCQGINLKAGPFHVVQ